MTTFNDIQSGRCQGQKRIDLSCGLTEFPQSLFQYADDLEILNLSNNHLSALPNNLSDFKKLRVLFLSENDFTVFPEVLAKCPNLTMIGFKSCQIKSIAEQALPKGLRWLILTDNQLESLPQSIGGCANLQKLMLSGNKLRSLPHALSECSNLELLRISANQLNEIPEWLFSMPKLAWLAFAGNPCVNQPHLVDQPLTSVPWYTLHIKQELGSGASGIISQAAWQGEQDIAVKVFKGKVTSDGFPYDEKKAAIHAGDHDHLVQVLGQVSEHPEQTAAVWSPSSAHSIHSACASTDSSAARAGLSRWPSSGSRRSPRWATSVLVFVSPASSAADAHARNASLSLGCWA